jgi:hypothetical protein
MTSRIELPMPSAASRAFRLDRADGGPKALPMTAARTLTQVGITPRLLTREQAAGYCGLRVTTFTAWVRRGIVPGPVSGTHRWDRKAIDLALDALSRLDDKLGPNALDQWEAKHHKRHAERNSSS